MAAFSQIDIGFPGETGHENPFSQQKRKKKLFFLEVFSQIISFQRRFSLSEFMSKMKNSGKEKTPAVEGVRAAGFRTGNANTLNNRGFPRISKEMYLFFRL